jgi:hypothetical protein
MRLELAGAGWPAAAAAERSPSSAAIETMINLRRQLSFGMAARHRPRLRLMRSAAFSLMVAQGAMVFPVVLSGLMSGLLWCGGTKDGGRQLPRRFGSAEMRYA